MKKYVWLNPVVCSAYSEMELSRFLTTYHFERVFPKINHLSEVKREYKTLLNETSIPVIDQRCPLIHQYFKGRVDVHLHSIEPILIHIARELAEREDLQDGYKWIICPCSALVQLGKSLRLKNMYFLTWDDFVIKHPYSLKGHSLSQSPIPFGFFRELSDKIVSRSCENLDEEIPKGVKLVEGLYCYGGCHRGDGVQCIAQNKKDY